MLSFFSTELCTRGCIPLNQHYIDRNETVGITVVHQQVELPQNIYVSFAQNMYSGTGTKIVCFRRLLLARVELPGLRLLTVITKGQFDSSILSSKAS